MIFCFVGDFNDMLVPTETDQGKVNWKCSICGKEFPHKCSGVRHIETVHFETPRIECEVCGKVLRNKNSYQKHINVTHGIVRRPGQRHKDS